MKKRKINPHAVGDFLSASQKAPSTTGITQENFETKLAYSLSFYQRNYDTKDSKKFLIALRPELASIVSSLTENKFNEFKTLGFLCKFLSENKLSEDFHEKTHLWMIIKINELLTLKKDKKIIEDLSIPPTNPQPQKVCNDFMFIDKIDEYVDEFLFDNNPPQLDVVEVLKESGISACQAGKLCQYYKEQSNEFNLIKSDKQLKSAYEFLSDQRLKDIKRFYLKLFSDIESFIGSTTQKSKKVKTPKTVSVEKQLSKVKFLKESTNFNISSILPEKVLGSSVVVLYNEKYKKLTILRGNNMTILGTTIQNFDNKQSKTKILRNPSIFVPLFKNANEIGLNSLWEEVRTNEQEATGRLSESTIIINVY